MNKKKRRAEERQLLFENKQHYAILEETALREGPIAVLFRATAQIEDRLTELLATHRKWAIVQDLARTTDDKVRLAFALEAISEDQYAIVRALNRLRNEVAHEWNAVIDEARITELMTSLPQHVRTNVEYASEAVSSFKGMVRYMPETRWLMHLHVVISVALNIGKYPDAAFQQPNGTSNV